jgi:hypothetical protein
MIHFLKIVPLVHPGVLFAACFLSSCTSHDFDQIPRTGFISHYAPSDKARMSFDSYWDISDNKDWDERITGQHGKSQPIYVMPVTTHFLLNYPTDPEKAEDVEELCLYFDHQLREKLAILDRQDNTFHLVDHPTRDAYRVQIALLSITPTNVTANAAGLIAGHYLKGSGAVLSQVVPGGSISMGAKFFSPANKLVAEVADYEKDESSVISYVLVDTKDFQYYAHHRRHIRIWCDQFCEIFTTPHEHKIRRPWFSLNPL